MLQKITVDNEIAYALFIGIPDAERIGVAVNLQPEITLAISCRQMVLRGDEEFLGDAVTLQLAERPLVIPYGNKRHAAENRDDRDDDQHFRHGKA